LPKPQHSASSNSPKHPRANGGAGQQGEQTPPMQSRAALGRESVPGLDLSPAIASASVPLTATAATTTSAEVAAAEVAKAAAEAQANSGTRLTDATGLKAVPPTANVVAGRRRIYRIKTAGLGVRVSPDVNAPRTGAILRRGDIFEASVVAPGVDGRVYLKVSGARGWVFDDSAIDLIDPSVEPITEEELMAQQAAQSGPAGHPSNLQRADPTAHLVRNASSATPPVPSLGILPFATSMGTNTPGGRSTPALAAHVNNPHVQLQELSSHSVAVRELDARPSSSRSSLWPPGPPMSMGYPERLVNNFRASSPSGGDAARQHNFAQASCQNPIIGIGNLPQFSDSRDPPGLSEEFREAMGGRANAMAKRRLVA